jgi:thiol-disulfide isomerase/thioredoxin
VPPPRRWAARALDVVAALIVVAAIARFLILPRLHAGAEPAPALTLATLDGGSFNLGEPRREVVFLEFWATWCEPCRDAIPLVQHFRRTHPAALVMSVDVGEPSAFVRPMAVRLGMTGVVLDPDAIAAHAFGVDGFPTLIAIDPRGRFHVVDVGFDPNVERAMSDAVARYN